MEAHDDDSSVNVPSGRSSYADVEVDPVVTGLIGFARRGRDAAATGDALKAQDDEKGKPAEMSGSSQNGV
jgi:hypothetical protein